MTNAEEYAVAEKALQRAFDPSLDDDARAHATVAVVDCLTALMKRLARRLLRV